MHSYTSIPGFFLRLIILCFVVCLGLGLLARLAGQTTPKRIIAYISEEAQAFQSYNIFLMDTERGVTIPISEQPPVGCCLSWSPDGQWIAFLDLGRRQIHTIHVETRELRQLTENEYIAGSLIWSPDGKDIAYTSIGGADTILSGLRVVGVDDRQIRLVTDETIHARMPVWSPDSSGLLFVSVYQGKAEIYAVGKDGGEPRQITHSLVDGYESLTFSPDGQHLTFIASLDESETIYRTNPDGRAKQRLIDYTRLGTSFDWSSDGRRIAFISTRDGEEELFVVNVESRQERQLTFNDTIEALPTWSPDGEQIMFLSLSPDRRDWALFLVDADGANLRRLSDYDPLTPFAVWQP